MKFNSQIADNRKLLMYKEAQSRLEESVLRLLLEQGINPDEFDDESFVVESDGNGNPIVWQVDLRSRLIGLSNINNLISTLEK